MTLLRSLCIAVLATALAVGQQSGDFNRDYTINFVGSFAPSYVQSNFYPGSCGSFFGGFYNDYYTSSNNAPVVWAMATQGTINWVPGLSANSIDIGPGGLVFILDGVNQTPPFLGSLARTNNFGWFGLSFPAAPTFPPGTTLYLAMAHATMSSPDGFYASQTHQLNWTTAPTGSLSAYPGATVLPPCDDCSYTVPIGFSFMFYGSSYTQIQVGSNGSLALGATGFSGGFEFDPFSFLSANEPRIQPYAADFNFNGPCGQLTHYQGAGIFEAAWLDVPQYGTSNVNSFRAELSSTGTVTLQWGYLDVNGANYNVLVGLTSGNNLTPGAPIDLSMTPGTLTGVVSPYEAFDFSNLSDVSGYSATFFLNAQGQPTSWIFY